MINCKTIAAQIKDELSEKDKTCKGLAIIQVGHYPGSDFYVNAKLKDASELGVPTYSFRYEEEDVLQSDLEYLIEILNANDDVGGIVIQSPLPKEFDEEKLVNMVIDDKDIDGFKASSRYIPATPRGVLTILNSHIDLNGKHVTLIGRGKTVGEPLIKLLLNKNATLTVCHSHTSKEDLKIAIQNSDVVISAVGIPDFISKDLLKIEDHYDHFSRAKLCYDGYYYVNPVIIDVGISRVDGKQVGDVSKEVHEIVDLCTPWTNGVGLMTRAALFQNLLED